jgi:hypothetical protein
MHVILSDYRTDVPVYNSCLNYLKHLFWHLTTSKSDVARPCLEALLLFTDFFFVKGDRICQFVWQTLHFSVYIRIFARFFPMYWMIWTYSRCLLTNRQIHLPIHIMLRDLLTQKCVQNFLVTNFGYPRACRFRKHQILNRSPEHTSCWGTC